LDRIRSRLDSESYEKKREKFEAKTSKNTLLNHKNTAQKRAVFFVLWHLKTILANILLNVLFKSLNVLFNFNFFKKISSHLLKILSILALCDGTFNPFKEIRYEQYHSHLQRRQPTYGSPALFKRTCAKDSHPTQQEMGQ
jgi:hypothetical protein